MQNGLILADARTNPHLSVIRWPDVSTWQRKHTLSFITRRQSFPREIFSVRAQIIYLRREQGDRVLPLCVCPCFLVAANWRRLNPSKYLSGAGKYLNKERIIGNIVLANLSCCDSSQWKKDGKLFSHQQRALLCFVLFF